MKYNKLVRDKIPEILKQKNIEATTSIADDKTYWNLLLNKLQEEVSEFIESNETEELADIYEVLDAIIAHKNIDSSELAVIKEKKKADRGSFSKRVVLHETEPQNQNLY